MGGVGEAGLVLQMTMKNGKKCLTVRGIIKEVMRKAEKEKRTMKREHRKQKTGRGKQRKRKKPLEEFNRRLEEENTRTKKEKEKTMAEGLHYHRAVKLNSQNKRAAIRE